MKTSIPLALALLAAAATPVPAAERTPTYTVRLYSFGFEPTPIVLRAGVPVTLVFTNTAGIVHEFTAPAFFRTARLLSGSAGYEGSVELRAHQAASVTLIPTRGIYEAHCGHFMHSLLGMHTRIYVE